MLFVGSESIKKIRQSQFVSITKNHVIWNTKNGKPGRDNADTIFNMILSDYHTHLNEANELVKKLCFGEMPDEHDINLIIESFYNELDKIHPFFLQHIESIFTNDIDEYFPAQSILIEQIEYLIAEKNIKHIDMAKSELELRIRPILRKIFPNFNEDEISDEFNVIATNMINRIKSVFGMPLSCIEEALNSLQTFIFLLTVVDYDANGVCKEYLTDMVLENHNTKYLYNYNGNLLKKMYNDISIKLCYDKNKVDDKLLDSKISVIKQKLRNNAADSIYHILSDNQKLINNRSKFKYKIYRFEQLVFLHLKFISQNNKKISICKHCKKPFFSDHANSRYCSRPIDEKSQKTCKSVGAKIVYEQNPVNHQLRNIRKCFNTKINRLKKYPDEQKEIRNNLNDWNAKAWKILDKYNNNKINSNAAVFFLKKEYEEVTKKVMERKKLVYPVVYIEDYEFSQNNVIIYVIFAINQSGFRDFLNIAIYEKDKYDNDVEFWSNILNKLKKLKVKNIPLLFSANYNGFEEALKKVFPDTMFYYSIFHQVKNTLKNISERNKKEFSNDLRKIYCAASVQIIYQRIEQAASYWKSELLESWKADWSKMLPVFKLPQEIRKAICVLDILEEFDNKCQKLNEQEFTDYKVLCNKLDCIANELVAERWSISIENFDLVYNELKELQSKKNS